MYLATSGGDEQVIKLVEKKPGAEQEVFIARDMRGVPHVMPLLDWGETNTHWALLMPRAELSLRRHIELANGPVPEAQALPILTDVARALAGLTKVRTRESIGVVHRDLKPENVLFWDGAWRLTDFGISRYAESPTGTDTNRHRMTHEYAAPEQLVGQRATALTDIYAFGIIAFELLTGALPFKRPDLWGKHLGIVPPPVAGVGRTLAGIVAMCLYKDPGDRLSANSLMGLLGSLPNRPFATGDGLALLERANLVEIARRSRESRVQFQMSALQSESVSRRPRTYAHRSDGTCPRISRSDSWHSDINLIGAQLRESIARHAFACEEVEVSSGWSLKLNSATLSFTDPLEFRGTNSDYDWADDSGLPFHVIAYGEISVVQSSGVGRAHSLWYCDAVNQGQFAWYETAFVKGDHRRSHNPFALNPDDSEAVSALTASLPEGVGCEVAWRFGPLDTRDVETFVSRWAKWFADASQGGLRPQYTPSADAHGSWRRDERAIRSRLLAQAETNRADPRRIAIPRRRPAVPKFVRDYPFVSTWPRIGASLAVVGLVLYGIWYIFFDSTHNLPDEVAIYCNGLPCTGTGVPPAAPNDDTLGVYTFEVHGMLGRDYGALCRDGYTDSWSDESGTLIPLNKSGVGCSSDYPYFDRDIVANLKLPRPGLLTVTWRLIDPYGNVIRSATGTVSVIQYQH